MIPLVSVADCKSPYDAQGKISAAPVERGTRIDVLSIKESVQANTRSEIRWIPTTVQLADGLTERDVRLRAMLAHAMGCTVVRLTDARAAL